MRSFLILFLMAPSFSATASSSVGSSAAPAPSPAVSAVTTGVPLAAPRELPAASVWSTEVRAWTDSFISAEYKTTAAKNFSFFGAQAKSPANGSSFIKMDLKGALALDAPPLSYINVSEIYADWAFPMAKPSGVQIGRKKSSWSELDSRWNLGVWQPVFKWNPLSPESQGLTGVFTTLSFENADLEVMGSGIYLPDQGPSFSVNDQGEFEKGNPWFIRPADSIRIYSESSKVAYDFQRPSESQVVMQKNYSARIRLHSDEFFVQTSYAYKPMNQLALGYDGFLNIPKDLGQIQITTAVQYQELFGADVQWHNEAFKVGLSGLQDRPLQNADFGSNADKWTRPVYDSATLVSPYADWNFLRGWRVRVQYLNISGGGIHEVGPLADPNRPPISRRYPYTEAQSAELSYEGRLGLKKPWQSSIIYTNSPRNQFDIIEWRGQVRLTKFWHVFSELLLVRAEAATLANQNEISQFENNDRFILGIGYAF